MYKPVTNKDVKIILPYFFYPKHKTELIRLGKDNDGGYLIPTKSIESTKNLYSFGLDDDFSFEQDFCKKKNISINCYDPTVDWRFWTKRFIRDLRNLILFKIKKNELKNIFRYFDYKKFFNSEMRIHHKKFIAPVGTTILGLNSNQIIDLDEMFINNTKRDIFLKIDIEASEYRILDQIIKYQSLLVGMAIEFHDCDLQENVIKNFVENFDLKLVHLHINNWGLINSKRFPSAMELTFSANEYNHEIKDEKLSFPRTLDQPCNPLFKDLPIEFK
jgi:hypothetical protein